jgi:lipopolysaccharide export system permease protein
MIQTYKSYLIILFLKKLLNITIGFFCLIFILNLFEEISFFKSQDADIFLPFILTFLNTPATIFDIFPFIFLIASQLFFIYLINKKELEILKINGLSNFRILKIISSTAFVFGVIIIIVFYSISSKMKFLYLDIKNNYSNDNKYLAVITENGLWVKDEIDDKILIVNASKVINNDLKNVEITEFDKNFELIRIITSENVNIRNKIWLISNPIISTNNEVDVLKMNLDLSTHFDTQKINSLFRNLSSLNVIELLELKKDYTALGYSSKEVSLSLHKIYSYPIFLSLMVVLSGILMLNIGRNRSNIFHIILGILLSVIIYYFYFLSSFFGQNGDLPVILSVWFPLIIILFISTIGLIRINEK